MRPSTNGLRAFVVFERLVNPTQLARATPAFKRCLSSTRVNFKKASPAFTSSLARTKTDNWANTFAGEVGKDPLTALALKNIGIRDKNTNLVVVQVLLLCQIFLGLRYSPNYVAGVLWSSLIKYMSDGQFRPAGKDAEAAWLAALEDVRKLEHEPALASELCYIVAHRLWNSRDLKLNDEGTDALPLAKYFLSIVLEMGNLKAALDLGYLANTTPDAVFPPAALKEVRAAARLHTDTRAMTIYIRHLLKSNKSADSAARKEAFEMAQVLSTMVQPAPQADVVRLTVLPTQKIEAPWVLLRDAADLRLQYDHTDASDPEYEEIYQALGSALLDGVKNYQDPDAARTLSDYPKVIPYSDQWIELKKQSALAGHSDSCWHLGRYYLEFWERYPWTGTPTTSRSAHIGYDWVELSAETALDDAMMMRERYFLLALFLRGAGMNKEGHEAIKRGLYALQNYCTDGKYRARAIRELEPFDRSWEHVQTDVLQVLPEDEKAPKLSKAQRHASALSGQASFWADVEQRQADRKAALKAERANRKSK